MKNPSRPISAGAGFTLVEMLVVLGVIGLLIAILLPVLSAARTRARAAQCLSNQRQLAAAALTRATQADGFLPLAGRLVLPDALTGYGSLPRSLADSSRQRYVYLDDRRPSSVLAAQELVAPWPVALAGSLGLGVEADRETVADWPAVLSSNGGGVYLCPDAPEPDVTLPTVSHQVGSDDHVVLDDVRFDFGLNEGLLGFHHDAHFEPSRRRGHLTRAGNASRTLVLGDADTREPGTQLLTWRPPLVEGEPKAVSLGEVVAAPAANLVDRSIRLDPNRHRGRANFVFADGHGETRRADAADLGGVMLLAD